MSSRRNTRRPFTRRSGSFPFAVQRRRVREETPSAREASIADIHLSCMAGT